MFARLFYGDAPELRVEWTLLDGLPGEHSIGGPELVSFHEQLYVFAQGNDEDQPIWYEHHHSSPPHWEPIDRFFVRGPSL